MNLPDIWPRGGAKGASDRRVHLVSSPSHFLLSSLLAAIVFTVGSAEAHDRGTSYSAWELRGRDARVVLRLTELDVSRFPWAANRAPDLPAIIAGYVADHLVLVAGDSPCAIVDGPHALATQPGTLVYEWKLSCADTGPLRIHSTLLREVSPSHLHFARVEIDDTAAVERVLSERGDVWELSLGSEESSHAAGTDLLGYILLGIDHILSGYDHLAFVLALLLFGNSIGELAKVVTGFTVGHSITLAAMVLEYLHPDSAPIEALIGLSIALVAAENCWRASTQTRWVPALIVLTLLVLAAFAVQGYGQVPAITLAGLGLFTACYFGLLATVANPSSLRWSIAFLFGLIHGFGFAAVLTEVGLPRDRILPALFGFNAGVELGQLAVVAVVWPLLRLLAVRRRDAYELIAETGSAGVLALGLFWFLTRAYG